MTMTRSDIWMLIDQLNDSCVEKDRAERRIAELRNKISNAFVDAKAFDLYDRSKEAKP